MSGNGVRVKSLCSLCEISLMRNHLMLQNVANIPFRLLRNVLAKLKVDHLCRLEESNVLLIFEDEEIWLALLKKDFPLHVHEVYQRKRDEIAAFYVTFVEEHDSSLMEDPELMKNFLRSAVRKDPATHKYKVPSRMLYFKYQSEMVRKQELSTQRLRMRMHEMQQEKEKNQIVPLEDPVYCERRIKPGAARTSGSERSGLFVKSYKEHQRRQQHFKSGGYDVKNRPVKRVAFGGQVGKSLAPPACPPAPVATSTTSATSPSAGTSPLNNTPSNTSFFPPSLQKRPSKEQNLFLKRRKPIIKPKTSSNNPQPSAQTSNAPKSPKPTVIKVNSTKINKKSSKSSIFAAPSPQQRLLSQHNQKPTVYIFDQTTQR